MNCFYYVIFRLLLLNMKWLFCKMNCLVDRIIRLLSFNWIFDEMYWILNVINWVLNVMDLLLNVMGWFLNVMNWLNWFLNLMNMLHYFLLLFLNLMSFFQLFLFRYFFVSVYCSWLYLSHSLDASFTYTCFFCFWQINFCSQIYCISASISLSFLFSF